MTAFRFLLVAGLVAAVGCGSGGTPGAVAVDGTVQLKNAPLDRGDFLLFPTDGTPPHKLDVVAGRFSGRVPPGRYKVQFSALKEVPNPNHSDRTPGSTATMLANVIPRSWSVASKEFREVTEAGPNTFAFDLR